MFNSKKQETISEFQKSQFVRILDIGLIAPFLIYAGIKSSNLHHIERGLLIGLGVTTFIYNLDNFMKNRKNVKKKP